MKRKKRGTARRGEGQRAGEKDRRQRQGWGGVNEEKEKRDSQEG